jgi:hypothetical protein
MSLLLLVVVIHAGLQLPASLACRSACVAASRTVIPTISHHLRSLSTSAAAWEADPQQDATNSSANSASEAASSFIVNPAGSSAAPQPAHHAPTAGGVLAGPGAASLKEYSMRQVSKHADDESCWIVVNGKVCMPLSGRGCCLFWLLRAMYSLLQKQLTSSCCPEGGDVHDVVKSVQQAARR